MLTLGLCGPDPSDVTSFYRLMGTYPYLAKHHPIKFVTGNYWSWEHMVQCDALVFQRPFDRDHATVCRVAKEMGVPLILEYDDNLFQLPPSNPVYPMYMNTSAHSNMRAMIAAADIVTVTTKALGDAIAPGKAVVIPNAHNDYRWPVATEDYAPKENVITWRGTATHHEDMEDFIPAIGRVARQFPDWAWHFLGDPHWGVGEVIPTGRCFRYQWLKFFPYIDVFRQIGSSIHIVTLKDSKFNRSKSNCAWIEATMAAGAVVIAPNWPEWQVPGVIHYNDVNEFEMALGGVIGASPQQRLDWVQASRTHIKTNLLLSEVNDARWTLLRGTHRN